MDGIMQKMYKFRTYSTLDHLIYKESLELRNELLRIPIGKSIYSENLKIEEDNTFFVYLKRNDWLVL